MLFYHTTRPEHLPAIDAEGLKPSMFNCGIGPLMTLGHAVVWLTTNPDEWSARAVNRITVRLEPNGKRLHHYLTWVADQARRGAMVPDPQGGLIRFDDMIERVRATVKAEHGDAAPDAANWWIYLGTIPRNRLALPGYELPAALAIAEATP